MTDKTEVMELSSVMNTWKIDTTDGRSEYISATNFRLCTNTLGFQFYDKDAEGVIHTKALFMQGHVVSIIKCIK